MIPALLPVIALALLSIYLASLEGFRDDRRSAFLAALVLLGVLIAASTEALSLLERFNRPGLILVWVTTTGVLAALIGWRHFHEGSRARGVEGVSTATPAVHERLPAILVAASAVLLLATAVSGLITPANTPDVLTYHLPRVHHWLQEGHVRFFPTPTLRELYQPPGHGFALAHVIGLAGSDRPAALVQWMGLLAAAIAASVGARQLGAGPRGQVFAFVFGITLPIGLLQSATAQSDMLAALWLTTAWVFSTRFRERGDLASALLLGGALGLACHTKATMWLLTAPVILVQALSLRQLRDRGWPLVAAATVVLCINVPHLGRNLMAFGDPLGSSAEILDGQFEYKNGLLTPSSLLSNVVRNAALHAGTPWSAINTFLEGAVLAGHEYLGIDASDPRTTWSHTQFMIPQTRRSEDLDGNPLQALVLLASVAWVFVSARSTRNARRLALVVLAGVVLFAAAFRWQPWHTRLHLPLFLLASPLAGVFLERFRRAGLVLAACLLVAAVPYAFLAEGRPLFGPRSILLRARPDLLFLRDRASREPYVGAAAFLATTNCREIGIFHSNNEPEYYLWYLLHKGGRGAPRIRHVAVKNVSHELATNVRAAETPPCAVVLISPEQSETLELDSVMYTKRWGRSPVAVFLPREAPAPRHGG